MDELARGRAWEAVRSLCFLPPPSDLPEGHTVVSLQEKKWGTLGPQADGP